MLSATEIEKYAEVMVWAIDASRPAPLKPGHLAVIHWDRPALPLAESVYRLLTNRHLHTVQRMRSTPFMEQSFYDAASPSQLSYTVPGQKEMSEALNASIHLLAPESLTHLSHVDPSSMGMVSRARKPLRDILDTREQNGDYSWSLCLWPTKALAEKAGMSLDDYARKIARACYLTKADPVMEWKHVLRDVKGLREALTSLPVSELHVESDQVDLVVGLGEHRQWLGVTGHNIPSFEIYVSPDYRKTRGVYYADQPSFRDGNRVKGARLEFSEGKVINASAEEGEEYLIQQLSMDEGANRVGEFSLTDARFSPIDAFMASTLFDENYGGEYGNCHIAVGASYASTYAGTAGELSPELKKALGFNSSALHWDLVNTEKKRVTAIMRDGSHTCIYENGQFTL